MREDSLLSLVLSLATVVFMFVFLNLYTIENNFDLDTTLSEVTVEVGDIEIVKQEEQIKDEVGGDVKNFSQDLNDGRETNNELAKNTEGENKTENQISEKEEIIVTTKLESKPNDFKVSIPSQVNSDFKYEGNVMVQWKMDGRTPHNNNSWYVRNPGYMCGFDEDGLLYLDITVNDFGDVIDVKINKEKSSNTNPCIIKYGVEYARMSRFSPSNNKQKGYIIYKFISQ
jgi:tRNA pseudouridine55 synthase